MHIKFHAFSIFFLSCYWISLFLLSQCTLIQWKAKVKCTSRWPHDSENFAHNPWLNKLKRIQTMAQAFQNTSTDSIFRVESKTENMSATLSTKLCNMVPVNHRAILSTLQRALLKASSDTKRLVWTTLCECNGGRKVSLWFIQNLVFQSSLENKVQLWYLIFQKVATQEVLPMEGFVLIPVASAFLMSSFLLL